MPDPHATPDRAAEFGLNPTSVEAIRLHEEGEQRARGEIDLSADFLGIIIAEKKHLARQLPAGSISRKPGFGIEGLSVCGFARGIVYSPGIGEHLDWCKRCDR